MPPHAAPSEPAYLPGLHGLRFLGALAVVVHHIEQLKSWSKIPSQWLHPVIQSLGPQGVGLFFTLSGFLITHLLLAERGRTGDISLQNFAIRRAGRILPLYYLTVLLAFAVMPGLTGDETRADRMVERGYAAIGAESSSVLALFLALLPNVALMLYPPMPLASHCWSIGIEEQFYVGWPALVRWLNVRTLAVVCGMALTLGLVVHSLPGEVTQSWIAAWGLPVRYLLKLPVENLMAGALAAIWLAARPLAALGSRWLLNGWLRAAALPAMLLLLTGLVNLGPFNALAYAWVILHLIAHAPGWRGLETPTLRYLGEISYGIYMFHGFAIYAALRLVESCLDRSYSRSLFNLSIYLVAFSVTLALAAASHRWFEQPLRAWARRLTTGRPRAAAPVLAPAAPASTL